MTARVFVEGNPVSQGALAHAPGAKHGMRHRNAGRLARWREAVGWAFLGRFPTLRHQLSEQALRIELAFVLRKPKSVRRFYPAVRPDLDKYVRACLDALEGVAYDDDAQVCSIVATKSYGFPAGVEIRLEAMNEGDA